MSKAKGFLKEFQEFAVKGNMVDLAVGVIIGAAFGKIIDSLVKDIMMPFINFILQGDVDFSNKFMVLSRPEGYTGPETLSALQEAGATVLAYGNFLTILINFILLAFVVFLLVKSIAKARAKFESEQPPAPPAPDSDEVVLLREIRDALKK
ncbi:large conductance mechanosensitive channel protein MscL [Pelistega sp. NLN82]|uniref:Large-conductance mechanosensitive channel n=1 Tax=Pelistega ratti TaxID=2652177 RepID=A0A6L9Y847_9BURK|nr:large conductance mechanosensitive channel protein MscL [Pelistega ratti]NEN76463.1 large conductance mechanosensitive channel protein MscL [Pelistega ratti]